MVLCAKHDDATPGMHCLDQTSYDLRYASHDGGSQWVRSNWYGPLVAAVALARLLVNSSSACVYDVAQ